MNKKNIKAVTNDALKTLKNIIKNIENKNYILTSSVQQQAIFHSTSDILNIDITFSVCKKDRRIIS